MLILALCMATLNSCTEEDPIEPEVDPREKFIGNWNVQEKINGQVTGAYASVVTNDASNTSRIKIGNIYNLGTSSSVSAVIAGNSMDISSQTITGITISGNGVFSNEGFVLNYTAVDGSSSQAVQATYTR